MAVLGNVLLLLVIAFPVMACFSLGYAIGHADGKEEAKEKNK